MNYFPDNEEVIKENENFQVPHHIFISENFKVAQFWSLETYGFIQWA